VIWAGIGIGLGVRVRVKVRDGLIIALTPSHSDSHHAATM